MLPGFLWPFLRQRYPGSVADQVYFCTSVGFGLAVISCHERLWPVLPSGQGLSSLEVSRTPHGGRRSAWAKAFLRPWLKLSPVAGVRNQNPAAKSCSIPEVSDSRAIDVFRPSNSLYHAARPSSGGNPAGVNVKEGFTQTANVPEKLRESPPHYTLYVRHALYDAHGKNDHRKNSRQSRRPRRGSPGNYIEVGSRCPIPMGNAGSLRGGVEFCAEWKVGVFDPKLIRIIDATSARQPRTMLQRHACARENGESGGHPRREYLFTR
jgi:hypothetical protein